LVELINGDHFAVFRAGWRQPEGPVPQCDRGVAQSVLRIAVWAVKLIRYFAQDGREISHPL
jgi:hypothetical protein